MLWKIMKCVWGWKFDHFVEDVISWKYGKWTMIMFVSIQTLNAKYTINVTGFEINNNIITFWLGNGATG